MKRLRERNLLESVRALTQPVLGICLGMQLLFDSSAEGETVSLGLIPGRVSRIPGAPGITVPHMGWNTVSRRRESRLLEGIPADARFYFVHSFAGPINEHTVASAEHGVEFAAVVERGNFSGVQFHPERSGDAGARLLQNFVGKAQPQP
jgi:imidazole glycerol-phosphate synthase subunit HisH